MRFYIIFEPEVGLRVSPSNINVERDATIEFSFEHWAGIGSATVSGFSSSVWDVTSNLTVSHGSIISRTIKANADYTTDNLVVSVGGSVGISVTVSPPNTNVSPFSFNTKILQKRNTLVESSAATLSFPSSGLTGASVSGDGNPEMQVSNDGGDTWSPWGGSWLFQSGALVRVRMMTSGSYNTSRVATVTAGGNAEQGTFTTKTEPDPGSGETLYIPRAVKPITSKDVEDHFGSPRTDHWGPPGKFNLSDYVRGGDYVPDITVNDHVPDAKPIGITNLLNAATTLFWTISPAAYTGTAQGAATLAHQWQIGSQFDVGYGERMRNVVQVKYSHEPFNDGFPGSAFAECEGLFDTWQDAQDNRWFRISHTVTQPTERRFEGAFVVEVRHPAFPSQTIRRNVNYSLQFSGV